SKSIYESTARTARFGDYDSGEGPTLRIGVVITGAACCCTGTDWGTTGAVSPGTGSGIAASTSIATGTGTAVGIGIGTGTATGT
ncbi:hypothetical protein KI387_020488, partial [Taxus chinensis]